MYMTLCVVLVRAWHSEYALHPFTVVHNPFFLLAQHHLHYIIIRDIVVTTPFIHLLGGRIHSRKPHSLWSITHHIPFHPPYKYPIHTLNSTLTFISIAQRIH